MGNVIGRRSFSGVLFAAALALGACSGGSTSDGSSGTTDPAFVGRWVGSWSSTGVFGSQTGTADLTIGNNGAISGTMHNSATGSDGTLSGQIDEHGQVAGTYAYGADQYTSSGQLLIQTNGHLGGAVDTYSDGSKVGTTTIDLVKQ